MLNSSLAQAQLKLSSCSAQAQLKLSSGSAQAQLRHNSSSAHSQLRLSSSLAQAQLGLSSSSAQAQFKVSSCSTHAQLKLSSCSAHAHTSHEPAHAPYRWRARTDRGLYFAREGAVPAHSFRGANRLRLARRHWRAGAEPTRPRSELEATPDTICQRVRCAGGELRAPQPRCNGHVRVCLDAQVELEPGTKTLNAKREKKHTFLAFFT